MSMSTKAKIVLAIAGFNEHDISVIEGALPAAERLLEAVEALGPKIDALIPDAFAVIPAAKVILAYVQKEN